jgi:hypothetical protein
MSEKRVDFTTLRVVCMDHSYVSCEEYEKIKKTGRRPREWKRLLEGKWEGGARKWRML